MDKGYRVGVGYYKNKSLAEEIAKENTHALPLYIDITSLESIEKAFNEIENSYGSIDILINNAGISQVKSFESLEEEDWQIMGNKFYECCPLYKVSFAINDQKR